MAQLNDENLQQHLNLITPKQRHFQMWIPPQDIYTYESNSYEEYTSDLLANLAQNLDLFIDINAHYGYFSLLVGQANPKCAVIACESLPEDYQILCRNLSQNQLLNARCLNRSAIADVDHRAETGQSASSAADQKDGQAFSIMGLLNAHKNSRILIRITSNENGLSFLEEINHLLVENNNIQLMLELNPKTLSLQNISPENLLRKISSLGFCSYFLDEKDHYFVQPPDNGIDSWKSILGDKASTYLYCKHRKISTNLLFFSHSSFLAGAERSLLELIKELTNLYGCMCTVVLPPGGPLKEIIQERGSATIESPIHWWGNLGESTSTDEINNNFSETYHWIMTHKSLLELINPDVILTNTIVIPWGAVAASMLKKPHIWMIREYGDADKDPNFFLPFDKILQYISDSSDMIIANSKDIQNTLFPHFDPNKLRTIYVYIDSPLKNINNSLTVNFYKIPDALHLIIPGTIAALKSQEDAIRATIELVKRRGQKVELLLVGYAELNYQKFLIELIAKEAIDEYVHILPFTENIYPLIQSADVVLLCSRKEPFGRVPLEAMLMGKPVIGSDAGGTREQIIDHQTGLLYTPGNFMQLADQIELLLNDPDLRNALAENGKRYVEDTLTQENYGGNYFKVICEIKGKSYQEKTKAAWFNAIENDWLISYLTSKLEKLDLSIQSLNAQLVERARIIQLLHTENAMYAASTSWQITRPLRKLVKLLKRGRNG